jgi:hypothetical protein
MDFESSITTNVVIRSHVVLLLSRAYHTRWLSSVCLTAERTSNVLILTYPQKITSHFLSLQQPLPMLDLCNASAYRSDTVRKKQRNLRLYQCCQCFQWTHPNRLKSQSHVTILWWQDVPQSRSWADACPSLGELLSGWIVSHW